MTGPLIIKNEARDPLAVDVGERHVLDLNEIKFDHRIKDLRVIGTWRLRPREEGGGWEECLVIGEGNRSLPNINPCIVPGRDLFKWSEESGDELYAATMAIEFCEHLANKSPHRTDDIMQVIDTVRLHLHDLKDMPPAPIRPRRIAGHIIIRTQDGRTIEKDVWEDV